MAGGNGDDVYVVDDAGDTVDETGGSGIDRVEALVSFSLASDTTGAVENLTLIGFGNLNGVGNALANTLVGNNNANNLNGNSGADLMQGRGGNDSYVVNEAGDVVDESLFGSIGTDEVLSFVSFDLSGPKALGAVENLRLAPGTANLNAHGNALANTLVGNNGVNVITGAAGNDTLTGDGGADFFVFTTALNAATNVDVIEDYTVAAGHHAAGEPVLHRPRQRHARGLRLPRRNDGGRCLGPHHLQRRHRRPLLRPGRHRRRRQGPLRRARRRAGDEQPGVLGHLNSRPRRSTRPTDSRGLHGLSRPSICWLRLGIGLERNALGGPQQNLRHERMHLT